jgi:hypothetical protein
MANLLEVTVKVAVKKAAGNGAAGKVSTFAPAVSRQPI